ncbi:alpha/beta fold hydrolase [Pedobacter sp. PLR]|uniref:alpha/beta fold hydrolase n=1 Tax=Pedobacter sp. PLR TaxID=2994465 RepID=UPI0022450BF3|nr:alpha/beta fold hydrolase [Pedobacter sp. PLR]MCX2451130.1 alpha/beta fold hydrolase [Pedobacter sp. PLR]
MKKVILLFFALLISVAGFSQGILSLFTRSEEFLKTMEQEKFPEAQGFFDISVQSKISAENLQTIWSTLTTNYGKYVGMDVVQSKSEGEYFTVSVDAEFEKGTQGFLLVFNKTEKLVGLFPRQLKKVIPYTRPAYVDTAAYKEKETYIETPGHSLVGVLTTPATGSNFPLVVFLHGSGPSDMDETVGPNKPFKDLAGGLASKGIASIRYVKRTLAYPGEFNKSFTVKEEIMDDALAAIALAKTIPGVDKSKVFLFGHSMGGMVAPRLAQMAPDLKGIVLAAAPARKLTDIIEEQNKYAVEQAKDTTGNLQKELADVLKETARTRFTTLGKMKPDSVLLGLPASYWADLNQYDQVAAAKKLSKQKIFVVQGAFDFQVSQQDFDLWKAALGKKGNVTLKLYPDLNHLFIPQTEKGSMAQYGIPGSVSPTLVDDLANWIKAK